MMEAIEAITPLVWWDHATWPEWLRYLLLGFFMAAQLMTAAIVVGRTGRTPYWALLSVVPVFYVLVVGIWGLAYCRWPRREEASRAPGPGA